MMAGWKVEVTGLRQLINALSEVDEKAVKTIKKEITAAGRAVAKNAKQRIPDRPVSNWGPFTEAKTGRNLAFDGSTIATGIKLRTNNYRRRGVSAGIGWDVVQGNAAGAIFEVVGDKSRVKTNSGAHLVDTINSRFPGKQPRSLIPAYYNEMKPELREQIRDQILDEARKAGLV